MCNAKEDDGACHLERRTKVIELGAKCRKCNVETGRVVLQIKDVYCKNCFLALCTHKFRSILGKSRILHGSTVKPILIAFSGSASSVTLLKLVCEGVALDQHQRRLMASPTVIYIDEGAVVQESMEMREKQSSNILSLLQSSGFPAYIIPLSLGEVFPTKLKPEGGNIDTTHDTEILSLFKSLPDLTSKLDMLQRIRRRVLVNAAKGLGIDKVCLAETATTLAAKILLSISLGRGAQVPLETGFLDDRESSVTFIRPMKDFSSKEVVFFNRFHGIEAVTIPSLLTQSPIDSSIQRLTEDFVVSVQSEFPSTVSTIYRTGDKLKVTHDCANNGTCVLCCSPLDTAAQSCTALEATEFSRSIPSKHNVQACGSTCVCNKSDALSLDDILSQFCYSCRLLARNMSSVNHLPKDVMEQVNKQISFNQMRNQIQEFLLE